MVGDEDILVTPQHPFRIQGKGWVKAECLMIGDKVRLENRQQKQILNIWMEKKAKPIKVYNLSVEDYHTYYVSGHGVLVHNAECSRGKVNILENVGESGSGTNNIIVTEDVIRIAMKDAPLKTQQKAVSIPVIQKYVDRVLAGEVDIPNIRVDGNIIVDGNHRYIASRITGIDVGIQVWSGGKPDNVIYWTDVILDTYDWGNR